MYKFLPLTLFRSNLIRVDNRRNIVRKQKTFGRKTIRVASISEMMAKNKAMAILLLFSCGKYYESEFLLLFAE